MSENNNVEQTLTEEQKQERFVLWQRENLQAAQKFLAEKGIITTKVVEKDCRFLPPAIAIWKFKDQKGKGYWAVSGQVPTDAAEESAASNPRDVLRYFSFQWQMKADGIVSSGVKEKTQLDFANLLVNRAHGLYDLYESDKLWPSEAS
ncbi:DUF4826 family protein [Pseudoalteromonas luteoviolacea]|uniref:DUF4826 domain-containing protein n=1 Tax=Pseudoalteromonas luteoviolacea DSM 6061 TaxID=1365250 RepID=A0A166YNN1_9GAMM|nr:DUF4826 family protein [Pseudoalteromonas luteoviolacea]KZN43060.1 hypothetical protein N475_00340 [Pseudoalteromonas luteoviolacea DSM 6061]KZN55382.1 hypothetical protein N474_15500 [Pseudoalteromonas luteoviolacea CPMOR-2]MBE0385568.1 hypothetical protein [Pseudoalteromonas luteoviolacea DSM 6061]TQF70569.1 DUF4826 family protein [Pseudoalteromonas luteoviolacea]